VAEALQRKRISQTKLSYAALNHVLRRRIVYYFCFTKTGNLIINRTEMIKNLSQ